MTFDLELKPGMDREPRAYWSRWDTVLTLYARCDMSRPNDKVLALGGGGLQVDCIN